MDDYHQLAYQLAMTVKLHTSILTEELERCGITRPQILLLEQIREEEKTIGELSKLIGLSYSTISGIVDQLEKEQLVTRKRDEQDRRVVWVSLTKETGVYECKVPFHRPEYSHALFDGMSKEEMEHTMQALTLLRKYLERKREALERERGSRR